MVIIVPTRRAQALHALSVVAAVALMVDTGSPLLLEHIAVNLWPDWAYWGVAGIITLGAVPLYWAMLPVGAARVLRRTN